MAYAVLSAYQKQDWKTPAKHTEGKNRSIINQLIEGRKTSRTKSITSGWRMQIVGEWNQKLLETRYKKTVMPWFYFTKLNQNVSL